MNYNRDIYCIIPEIVLLSQREWLWRGDWRPAHTLVGIGRTAASAMSFSVCHQEITTQMISIRNMNALRVAVFRNVAPSIQRHIATSRCHKARSRALMIKPIYASQGDTFTVTTPLYYVNAGMTAFCRLHCHMCTSSFHARSSSLLIIAVWMHSSFHQLIDTSN